MATLNDKATTPDDLAQLAQTTFEAEITLEEVEDMERHAQALGVERRIALMTLARSRDELLTAWRADPDVAMDIVERLTKYKNHLSASIELADAAVARLMIVLAAISQDESGDLGNE